MKAITENTTVNLTVVATLIGGVVYVTYTAFQGAANAKAIEELKTGKAAFEDRIEMKIDRIEAKLDRMRGR